MCRENERKLDELSGGSVIFRLPPGTRNCLCSDNNGKGVAIPMDPTTMDRH